MKAIHGCSDKWKELARRLAPGRSVKSITINCQANGVVTATVEVYVEPDDIPLIESLEVHKVTTKQAPMHQDEGRAEVGNPFYRM